MRKLVGRGMTVASKSASESFCQSDKSGTVMDLLGVGGSDGSLLVVSVEEGNKILIKGLVINPNTWCDGRKNYQKKRNGIRRN